MKEVLNDKDISFKFYLERVDKLYEESVKMGSVPIFINQLDATGFDNKQLVSLNTFLIDHCEKKIPLHRRSKKIKWKKQLLVGRNPHNS
mgnify:CR=1 FL=1